jgi:hypothetical protein
MLSFIYITCRKSPKLEWFIDSLYNQVEECGYDPANIQIVVVDFELQYDDSRRTFVSDIIKNRFDFVHVEPKPSLIQGKHKITKKNYFAASIPRNTGICYAKYEYLLFIDDLSVLLPGSFKHIIELSENKMVMAFSYKKVFDLSVVDGNIKTVREHSSGIDSRWQLCNENTVKVSGSQFFGYGAAPLDVLLSVNGYDEICNTMGGEDYNIGIRLEKCGYSIFYTNKVIFYESEELADQGNVFIQRDPVLRSNDYTNLMRKYNIVRRAVPDGTTDLSHLLLDMVCTRDKIWTEGNNFNLRDLRVKILNGELFENTDTEYSLDGVHYSEIENPLIETAPPEPDIVLNNIIKPTINKKFIWNRI